jgi:hypothetical protein
MQVTHVGSSQYARLANELAQSEDDAPLTINDAFSFRSRAA